MEGFNKMKTMKIKLVYNKMPLFFYIFPLPNGEANVSLGGLSVNIQKQNQFKERDRKHLCSHVISCYFKCAANQSMERLGNTFVILENKPFI